MNYPKVYERRPRPSQIAILHLVTESGITAVDLASHQGVTTEVAGRKLSALMKRNCLDRRKDGRTFRYFATDVGKEVVERLAKERHERECTARAYSWDRLEENGREARRRDARADLQAAVVHLGGTDAH